MLWEILLYNKCQLYSNNFVIALNYLFAEYKTQENLHLCMSPHLFPLLLLLFSYIIFLIKEMEQIILFLS